MVDLHAVLVQSDGEIAIRQGDQIVPVAADFAELCRESEPVGRAAGVLMVPVVVGVQSGTRPIKPMPVELTREGELNEPEDPSAYVTAIKSGTPYSGSYRLNSSLTRVGVRLAELDEKRPDNIWVPLFVLKEPDGHLVPIDARYYQLVHSRTESNKKNRNDD